MASGFSHLDPKGTSSTVSIKEGFFFVFLICFIILDGPRWRYRFMWLAKGRSSGELLDLAFHHIRASLSKKSGCGKRVDSAGFLRPSADFALFPSNILIVEGNPSMSRVFWPVISYLRQACEFCSNKMSRFVFLFFFSI